MGFIIAVFSILNYDTLKLILGNFLFENLNLFFEFPENIYLPF